MIHRRNTSQPRGTERIAKYNPFITKSYRGLRNTGNTCFLNALGAIDEVSQMHSPTMKSTITQDRLRDCVKELQRPGTAYMPTPLIQQIPDLICHKTGDPADAHELLITLINDVSEPISQLFQGQMTSTIKCSECNSTTFRTDIRKTRVRRS